MKILLTGAAGFIGSHLADRLLDEGHSVVGIDNYCDFYDRAVKERNIAAAGQNDRFTLIEADIRDRAAMMNAFAAHQPDRVVHLAAMAGVRPSIERPDYYTSVNLDGTVNLLDAAVENKTAKFIFASSSSVYGNNKKTPFAEDDNVDHPISPYAATKKAGELICHSYAHLHDLPIAMLRFFTVFGPRQRPDLAISKFLGMIDRGETIPMFGDGSTSRDYTFVTDIVTGIRAAMDTIGTTHHGTLLNYRIWNLGGSSPISLRDMIATIERITGKTANIKQLPMQPGDVNQTFADLTRSKDELKYEPTTSFEAGVAQQWQWMQSL